MIAGSRKSGRKFGGRLRGCLLLGVAFALSAPASAQDDDELPAVSRAVVQPLPARGSYELNAALTRLAANPRDVSALLDAGAAAMTLGDTEAALGFLGRADQLSPGNPRVKSALASALLRNEDPFAAIPLFDAAERAGARDAALAGDRGLAYDLVGDNPRAQGYYRQALAAAPNDEIVRRLALSQAIGGDKKAAEATLLSQLRRNDPAAWRTRAMILAIVGEPEEAVKIAYGTMPRDLANSMAPYLRYMGRLTPAQQAAAANFGHFPRAAQIGRDDPRVARFAVAVPRRPAPAAAAPAAKVEPGDGKKARASRSERRASNADRRRAEVRTVAQAPTKPAPTPTPTPAAPPVRVASAAPPPVRIAAATPNPNAMLRRVETGPPIAPAPASSPVQLPPATVVSTASPTPAPASSATAGPVAAITLPPSGPPASTSATVSSALDLTRLAQAGTSDAPATATTASAIAPVPVQSTPPRRDLSAAFGDFRPPAEELTIPAIAVDISKIAPARANPVVAPDARGPLPDAPTGTSRSAAAEPPVSAAKTVKGAAAKGAKTAAKDTKPAKPAAPSHPSRIWVQIGVGRDKGALGFDWRKYGRTQAELFKAKKAWTTPWGQTNRLLVGPFETQAAAQAFLKQVRKEDVDAFVWTSPAGQAVDALATK